MKQRICLLLLLMLTLRAFALDKWDGRSYAEPAYDNGYKVYKASELAWIASASQNRTFEDTIITLYDDLDLNSYSFMPIGRPIVMPFSGHFNGNGHYIKNFLCNHSNFNGVGLFAQTSQKGVIENLALAQGVFFLNDISDVGGIVGINYGRVSHCFSMVEIIAHDGSRVGGLVGYNAVTGIVEYCYNTGIISDARDNIGGLVGLNDGKIQKAYNIGYSVNGGAAVGKNLTEGGMSDVYCDQKMCRKEAGTGDLTGVTIMVNTVDMYPIFKNDPEWQTSDTLYAQLKVFADTKVSLVSVSPAVIIDQRTERAETLTSSLSLSTANSVSWFSPMTDVIRIYGSWGDVTRPCQTQQVTLEARLDGLTKKVYTMVKGYDVFSAGQLVHYYHTCLNHPVVFSSKAVAQRAAGGKDDDAEHAPYSYRIEKYHLEPRVVNGDTVAVDTLFEGRYNLNAEDYSEFSCSADRAGVDMYFLYAHDAKCQKEFILARDTFFLDIYDEVDPGEIDAKVDTLYGSYPKQVSLTEVRQPTGGNGDYHYEWYETDLMHDYVLDKVDTILKDQELKVNRQSLDTFQCEVTIPKAGEYIFSRMARDSYCMDIYEFLESVGQKKIVAFETLYAGRLTYRLIDACGPVVDDTLTVDSLPSGGNGRYQYRWLCNGQIIVDATTADLYLKNLTLQYGGSYTFRRQVKDDTGLMDWTDTEGLVTVNVRPAFSAGAILDRENSICLDAECLCGMPLTVIEEKEHAHGEGPMHYYYLVSYERGKDTVALDTFFTDAPFASLPFSPKQYPVALPTTFFVQRVVSDTLCHAAGVKSEGMVTLHIGKEEVVIDTLRLCPEQLPYKMQYQYLNKFQETFVVERDSQVVHIVDYNLQDCRKDVYYVAKVRQIAEVEVEDLGMICQSENQFDIGYRVVSGHPTHCEVFFDDRAHQAGLQDTIIRLDDTGTITIDNSSYATGTFSFYVRFFDEKEANRCEPNRYDRSFTFALDGYVYRKWTDVLYADNNDKNGYPNPLYDKSFVSWAWYKNGTLVEGQTEQFYYEQGGLNGIYYVVMRDAEGNEYRTCDIEARPLTALETLSDGVRLSPTALRTGEVLSVFADDDVTLTIYNLDGVALTQAHCHAGSNSITIDLPIGAYIVVTGSHNATTRTKIMVY